MMNFDIADSPRDNRMSHLLVSDIQDSDLEDSNLDFKKQITPIKHEDLERTILSEAQQDFRSFPFTSGIQLPGTNTASLIPPEIAGGFDTGKKPREQAKVSPYMSSIPKQETLSSSSLSNFDRFRGVRSPKQEVKLPPLELDMPHTTHAGKMAYVSPTVRSAPNPQIKLSAPNTIYSSSLFGQKHKPSNLNFASGGTSQLSPVQAGIAFGQPVILNAGPQLEVHRYVNTMYQVPQCYSVAIGSSIHIIEIKHKCEVSLLINLIYHVVVDICSKICFLGTITRHACLI